MQIGEKIEYFSEVSEIFRSGDDHIIKVYHQNVPRKVPVRELHNLVAACVLNLPVPRPDNLFEVNGRTGLRMQYINGYTLLDLMGKDPSSIESAGAEMADQHVRIHNNSGQGFPAYDLRYNAVLSELADANPVEGSEIRDLFLSMPSGTTLCHGDFHPANIMFDGRKSFVIDWLDANAGPIEADIARTLMIIDYGGGEKVDAQSRARLRDSYLSRYMETCSAQPNDEHMKNWYKILVELQSYMKSARSRDVAR